MFEKLTNVLSTKKGRNLALVGGAMVGLTVGAKMTPAAIALKGILGLEDEWRRQHPDFRGSLAERWEAAIEFYDATHQDPVNRALHTVGIPMIVGGLLGMMAAPRYTPPWWVANGSWTFGWALNFLGHGVFEKDAPAFAEDPLAFIAGPVWDFVRIRDRVMGEEAAAKAPSEVPPPDRTHAAA